MFSSQCKRKSEKTGEKMGREPCCCNEGMNRGAWTALEDEILTAYVKVHGEGHWRNLPKRAGLKRCGKSCRLRWKNYLRPDIKRGNISSDEEDLIIRLHNLLGNRWSLIAKRLPGRTDNEIKNYWNTKIRKKVKTQLPLPPASNSKRTNKPSSPDLRTAPAENNKVQVTRTKATKCTRVFLSLINSAPTPVLSPTYNNKTTELAAYQAQYHQNHLTDYPQGCDNLRFGALNDKENKLLDFDSNNLLDFCCDIGDSDTRMEDNLGFDQNDLLLNFNGQQPFDDMTYEYLPTNIYMKDNSVDSIDIESFAFLLDTEDWP